MCIYDFSSSIASPFPQLQLARCILLKMYLYQAIDAESARCCVVSVRIEFSMKSSLRVINPSCLKQAKILTLEPHPEPSTQFLSIKPCQRYCYYTHVLISNMNIIIYVLHASSCFIMLHLCRYFVYMALQRQKQTTKPYNKENISSRRT